MKKDFIEYIKKEFGFDEQEVEKFETSLNTPLKKSIRINTNKISIEDFKIRALKNNWTLTATNLWKNTFYIDREDAREVALGNTPEHIAGYFYVQEVAASSSPFYMSDDKIDKSEYLILDMSASPGWKTTQLQEYYPNSLIVANELDKSRLKWFFSNLDRMSSLRTVATNYDGRFFKNTPEIFDKILLDAPCSWEWTAFKTDEALRYWNLKNIKIVSKLQYGLLDSAIKSCKVWWEVIYSTCTLNKFENEWVINKALKKYWDCIEIVPLDPHLTSPKGEEQDFDSPSPSGEGVRGWGVFMRNWPHLNFTGWFFVAKIKKIKSLTSPQPSPSQEREQNSKWDNKKEEITKIKQNIEKVNSTDKKKVLSFFEKSFDYDLSNYWIYNYKWEIHLTDYNLEKVIENIFLYKIWVKIWELKDWIFVPNFYSWTFKKFSKNTLEVNKSDLDRLLKWFELESPHLTSPEGEEYKDWYYQIIYDDIEMGIAKAKNSKIKSLIPTKLMRN